MYSISLIPYIKGLVPNITAETILLTPLGIKSIAMFIFLINLSSE